MQAPIGPQHERKLLRFDDLRQRQAARDHRDGDRPEDHRQLVSDDLRDCAQAAEQRELAL